MLSLLFACCVIVFTAFAAVDPLQVQSLDVHRVWKVDDLSPSDLKDYSVIFVKNESSIILPLFLYERAYDPNFFNELKTVLDPKKLRSKFQRNRHFVQTHYSRSHLELNKTETFPLDGCFDNTLSETTSLLSRSYEKSTLRQGGLNLIASLLGFELDLGTTAGLVDTLEEKVICSVEPGQKLQLQATLIRKQMRLHRQRSLHIAYSPFSGSTVICSDWEEIEGPTQLELVMKSLACVTDQKYLSC